MLELTWEPEITVLESRFMSAVSSLMGAGPGQACHDDTCWLLDAGILPRGEEPCELVFELPTALHSNSIPFLLDARH